MASTTMDRNAVRVHGDGAPVLLVHGFGCDQAMWGPMEKFLAGHQVIRYDLTGMGASDYHAYDAKRHGSLRGHAQDLIQILDGLAPGPVVAVGHSVSAMIIGLASIERPDLFRGLVMLCPNPRYIDDPPYVGGFDEASIDGLLEAVKSNYQGWAGNLAALVAGPQEPEAEATLNDRFCRNDPLITQHFAQVTFKGDNREDVSKITTPTLLVQTAKDAIVPPDVAAFMISQLPSAESVVIDCAGHAPHMARPRETADAILDFIEGLHA